LSADDDSQPVLVNPVPSFNKPFRPQLPHHVVDTKPFSFESRTQEMLQRREQRLNDVIAEEQKVTFAAYTIFVHNSSRVSKLNFWK